MRRLVHPGRKSTGQGLVEMALVVPVFMLIVIALFDLGRATFAYNTLTNAAREGARFAIVNQDPTKIVAWAKKQTAIVELNDPSVRVNFYQAAGDGSPDTSRVCSPVAVGCLVQVRFEATYTPITPIISRVVFGSGVTFEAKAVLSVEYSCPNSTFTADQCPKQP